jgi:hypothetical protein
MPMNKSTKFEMQPDSTAGRTPLANASQKLRRKAPGTRIGILQDWRHGSTSEKASRREANRLRDGR